MRKENKKKAVKKAVSKKAIKKTAPKKKNKGGRPALYKTPAEMQAKIDEYFETQVGVRVLKDEAGKPICNIMTGMPLTKEVPPTQSDMALYLGFSDRQSLYDNAKRSEEFSCTIKKAYTRIDAYAEKGLFVKGKPTGEIFYLKNRGWSAEENRTEKKKIEGNITVNDLSKLSDKQLKEMAKAAALDIDDGTEE